MYRLIFLLASMLLSISCSKSISECESNEDCLAGRFCDDEVKECVECLSHNNCGQNEFCCSGHCRALVHLTQFCGCDSKRNGSPGVDCEKNYELGTGSIGGPVCQVNGSEDVESKNVALATCGCLGNNSDCSVDSAGLAGYCSTDFICEAQSAKACGAPLENGKKKSCSTLNGGPICRDPNLSGYGDCGCDASLGEKACSQLIDGHQIADTCNSDAKCTCQNSSTGGVCTAVVGTDISQQELDCCGDGCVNLSNNTNNCGKCSNSCALGKQCFLGACECNSTKQCQQSPLTDICGNVELEIDAGKFAGSLCICSAYHDPSGKQFLPCPVGSFCCPTGLEGPVGCCSKPCGVAKQNECRVIY